jgi:hypothetical protein
LQARHRLLVLAVLIAVALYALDVALAAGCEIVLLLWLLLWLCLLLCLLLLLRVGRALRRALPAVSSLQRVFELLRLIRPYVSAYAL